MWARVGDGEFLKGMHQVSGSLACNAAKLLNNEKLNPPHLSSVDSSLIV